jgi:hypothetical protein
MVVSFFEQIIVVSKQQFHTTYQPNDMGAAEGSQSAMLLLIYKTVSKALAPSS